MKLLETWAVLPDANSADRFLFFHAAVSVAAMNDVWAEAQSQRPPYLIGLCSSGSYFTVTPNVLYVDRQFAPAETTKRFAQVIDWLRERCDNHLRAREWIRDCIALDQLGEPLP